MRAVIHIVMNTEVMSVRDRGKALGKFWREADQMQETEMRDWERLRYPCVQGKGSGDEA